MESCTKIILNELKLNTALAVNHNTDEDTTNERGIIDDVIFDADHYSFSMQI